MSVLGINQTDSTRAHQSVPSLNEDEGSLTEIVRRTLSNLAFPGTIIEIINDYTINAYTFESGESLSLGVLSPTPSTPALSFSRVTPAIDDIEPSFIEDQSDSVNDVEIPTVMQDIGEELDEETDSEPDAGLDPETTLWGMLEAQRLGILFSDFLREFG